MNAPTAPVGYDPETLAVSVAGLAHQLEELRWAIDQADRLALQQCRYFADARKWADRLAAALNEITTATTTTEGVAP